MNQKEFLEKYQDFIDGFKVLPKSKGEDWDCPLSPERREYFEKNQATYDNFGYDFYRHIFPTMHKPEHKSEPGKKLRFSEDGDALITAFMWGKGQFNDSVDVDFLCAIQQRANTREFMEELKMEGDLTGKKYYIQQNFKVLNDLYRDFLKLNPNKDARIFIEVLKSNDDNVLKCNNIATENVDAWRKKYVDKKISDNVLNDWLSSKVNNPIRLDDKADDVEGDSTYHDIIADEKKEIGQAPERIVLENMHNNDNNEAISQFFLEFASSISDEKAAQLKRKIFRVRQYAAVKMLITRYVLIFLKLLELPTDKVVKIKNKEDKAEFYALFKEEKNLPKEDYFKNKHFYRFRETPAGNGDIYRVLLGFEKEHNKIDKILSHEYISYALTDTYDLRDTIKVRLSIMYKSLLKNDFKFSDDVIRKLSGQTGLETTKNNLKNLIEEYKETFCVS